MDAGERVCVGVCVRVCMCVCMCLCVFVCLDIVRGYSDRQNSKTTEKISTQTLHLAMYSFCVRGFILCILDLYAYMLVYVLMCLQNILFMCLS